MTPILLTVPGLVTAQSQEQGVACDMTSHSPNPNISCPPPESQVPRPCVPQSGIVHFRSLSITTPRFGERLERLANLT